MPSILSGRREWGSTFSRQGDSFLQPFVFLFSNLASNCIFVSRWGSSFNSSVKVRAWNPDCSVMGNILSSGLHNTQCTQHTQHTMHTTHNTQHTQCIEKSTKCWVKSMLCTIVCFAYWYVLHIGMFCTIQNFILKLSFVRLHIQATYEKAQFYDTGIFWSGCGLKNLTDKYSQSMDSELKIHVKEILVPWTKTPAIMFQWQTNTCKPSWSFPCSDSGCLWWNPSWW